MEKIRYHSLDSLRGIASLQVLIGHCLVALPALNWWVYVPKVARRHDLEFYFVYSPLHFFWSATPAVKVFFVLSGFVLSIPYYSAKKPYYINFFFKRILRLYIPCLVMVGISIALSYLFYKPHQVEMFGDWVQKMWGMDYNWQLFFDFLKLNVDFGKVNIALWTIPPEIKLSLILPLFIIIQKKLDLKMNIVFFISFFILITLLNKIGLRNYWNDFITFFYFTFFLIGSLLCKYKSELLNWVNNLTPVVYFIILAVSILIYTYEYSLWWLPFPAKIWNLSEKFEDYISAFASIFFLIFALSDRAKKLLNNKSLLFLGKVSFSIYLLHPVLITLMAHTLGSYLNRYFIISFAFILCFPASYLFYRLIEVPSLNFAISTANYLTNKYFKTRTGTNLESK